MIYSYAVWWYLFVLATKGDKEPPAKEEGED